MHFKPLLQQCCFLVCWIPALLWAQDGEKPNVLFLICDDLNCDIGSYGHPLVQTPNIDRLASRGVRFDRAYCQYPLCGPSRASFMTGLYPDQTLIRRNAIYVREHLPSVKSIPQMFRDAGYFATRIGKIYHYNVPKHIGTSGHDDPYSWNQVFNPRGRDVEDEPLIFSLQPGSFGGTLSWLAADGEDSEQTDAMIADETIRQLQGFAESGKSFYLAVGLFRPHTPYVAPKKYFDLYPLESITIPSQPEDYLETLPKPAATSIRRKKNQVDLDEKLARECIQSYYASITFADAQIGRILDGLEASGLAKNTIVIFTSDHGYHMGEHGHWQKTTLFENATRVPLIMAGPGISAEGKSTETPVEMVDFYPTLAQLSGLMSKAPNYLSGVSLVPVLNDPENAAPRGSAFSQYANGYSIRTARYRYTEWGEEGSEGNELYDHQTDAEELVNLAQNVEYEGKVNELREELHQRIRDAQRKPDGLEQMVFENRRRVR
tara:strand:+ start:2735 stop:4204 length:1470 start_codon:yes stop_codon:yes gene_type:complete